MELSKREQKVVNDALDVKKGRWPFTVQLLTIILALVIITERLTVPAGGPSFSGVVFGVFMFMFGLEGGRRTVIIKKLALRISELEGKSPCNDKER